MSINIVCNNYISNHLNPIIKLCNISFITQYYDQPKEVTKAINFVTLLHVIKCRLQF
ncbi:hypothetical protein CsatA_004999 [Cannabis sativa]